MNMATTCRDGVEGLAGRLPVFATADQDEAALLLERGLLRSTTEAAWCDAERLRVALTDGRRLGVPLAWFPREARAGAEAREAVETSDRAVR